MIRHIHLEFVMKMSRYILPSLATVMLSVFTAQAETYWVDGITFDEAGNAIGWYDANKTPSYANGDGGYEWVGGDQGDVSTCHAATAANLIAWWQNHHKENIPQGVPTAAQEIWNTYKQHQIMDTSGQVSYSFQWWLTGVQRPKNDEEAALTRDGYCGTNIGFESTDGYYTPMIKAFAKGEIDEISKKDVGVSAELSRFFDHISYQQRGEDGASVPMENTFHLVCEDIMTAVAGGKGVALELIGSSGSHALTLWGIETVLDANDKEIIYKLWLTDSDDSKTQYGGITTPSLFYVFVNANKDGNMEIAKDGNPVWNDGYLVYSEDSDRGLNGFVVNGITTIDPTVSEAWNWSLLVPEPTTTTLSLLGLVALAARRRRR